jgi:hypothetical protein
MMSIALLAATLAAQILAAPGAVRWEPLVEDSSGPSFIDPDSIVREGHFVRYVTRNDLLVADAEGVRMKILLLVHHCRRPATGLIAGDLHGEDGRFLRSIRNAPGGIWFLPMSSGAGPRQVHRRVCARAAARR